MGDVTQSDELFIIYAGLKASAGDQLSVEMLPFGIGIDLAANRESIGGLSFQGNAYEMIMVELPAVIAIDGSGLILVVDDQVEVAIAVQISISGAIGEGGLSESPVGADVLETEVAQVAIDFIQQWGLGNVLQQFIDILFLSAERHFLVDVIGEEVEEVKVRDIPIDAVANIDIVEAVVVHIEHQGAPAPVGGGDAAVVTGFQEFAVTIVDLEAVLNELIVEAGAQLAIEEIDIIEGAGGLQSEFITGQHVGSKEVGKSIIVDIGHVGTHGGHAYMAEPVFQLVFERSILLIDVEVILFIRVIGHVDVGPAVPIDIRYEGAQAEADKAAVDACFLRDLCKMSVVIAEEVVAASFEAWLNGPCRVGKIASIRVVEGVDGNGAVIDHEAIQIAVTVIVKKGHLSGVSGYAKAVSIGCLCEGEIMVIDVELILSIAIGHMTGVADIDVQPAVVIDVYEYYSCAPHAVLTEAGFAGDIFELEIAFIEIELIAGHVGGEEDIGEAVVVDVADGYAAAVVEVTKEEAVVQSAVMHIIFKMDACVLFQLEEGCGGRRVITG